MKPKIRTGTTQLEKGQLWEMKDVHIEIVELGKHLTHYRLFHKSKQKRVPISLDKIQTVQDYLIANHAVLAKSVQTN